jgi:hypothetical protein
VHAVRYVVGDRITLSFRPQDVIPFVGQAAPADTGD